MIKDLPLEFQLDNFRADFELGLLYWSKSGKGRRMWKPVGCMTGDGYRQVRVNGKLYVVHRILWAMHNKRLPEGEIDHIDGDRANNAILNLRVVAHKQNMQNAGIRSDNASGTKGVFWHAMLSKWVAQIHVDGKNKYLGGFHSLEEASKARAAAEQKYFGEFARAAA